MLLTHHPGCVDCAEGEWNPLIYASAAGHASVVSEPAPHFDINQTIIQRSQNQVFRTAALLEAARNGQDECVARLLQLRADPLVHLDEAGCSALHVAASYGHNAVVEQLLIAGMEVDLTDRKRRTALHLASAGGHPKLIAGLIANGACVNARDSSYRTALHYAAAEQQLECLELLLSKGVDPEITDR